MTAPLHERLEAYASDDQRDADTAMYNGHDSALLEERASDLREAAAALRPPEGEVGALCERIEGWVSGGLPLHAEDVRAALAHLRRLAAVEAERDRDREVLAWLVDTLTEISFDGGDYDGSSIQEDLTMLGVLHQTEYDPQRHGDNADCEPGDPYFEFTPYGKALIRVANEKRRALASAPAAESAR